MGQLYLQRFEYRGAIDKTTFDKAWEGALTTFAETGNWGGVAKGVTHRHTYGTGWGGYALIEVDDPEAFAHYQAHHNQHYGHIARVSWEPLFDMDAAFGSALKALRAKAR